MRQLTSHQISLIANALGIAAEAYFVDAGNAPFPRVAEQFRAQFVEANELKVLFEAADAVAVEV